MALELPGVTRIDTPAEARAHARRWRRQAAELDPQASEQVAEYRTQVLQRAAAAEAWARQEEDALLRARQAHDGELERHLGAGEHERGGSSSSSSSDSDEPQSSSSSARRRAVHHARRAGNAAYARARPPAMRIAHRSRQHFFAGVKAPFGPVASGWDLFMEALGASLVVVLLVDLLSHPAAVQTTSSHALGAVQRIVDVTDPITGARPPATASTPAPPKKTQTV